VARDQLIAEYQARSAVNLARVVLHAEPTIRRAITPMLTPLMAMMGRGLAAPPQIPIWEQADLIIGPFRGQEGGQMRSASSRASTPAARTSAGSRASRPW
jgi:general secretion pathway protein K